MKPTHLRTPRTLDQGSFARGYTTEPVGRRALPRWIQRTMDALLAFALGIALALLLVAGLVR
jgi:hypothetical protein